MKYSTGIVITFQYISIDDHCSACHFNKLYKYINEPVKTTINGEVTNF